MTVREKYRADKTLECETVFRTADPKHPGVAKVLGEGEINIAGPVRVLSEGEYPAKYPSLYLRPEQVARRIRHAAAGGASRLSRRAIPCTARTSIWPRSPPR